MGDLASEVYNTSALGEGGDVNYVRKHLVPPYGITPGLRRGKNFLVSIVYDAV